MKPKVFSFNRTFDFDGSFTQIYWDIPLENNQQITDVQVEEAGFGPYQQIQFVDPGRPAHKYAVVREGNSEHIEAWHSSENESKTFVLSYKVTGAVQKYQDVAEFTVQNLPRETFVEALINQEQDVTPNSFTATLLDLARRKFVKIEAKESDSHEYTLHLLSKTDSLEDYEQDLLDFVFGFANDGKNIAFEVLKKEMKGSPLKTKSFFDKEFRIGWWFLRRWQQRQLTHLCKT